MSSADLDESADPLALERQVCFALVVAARSVLSVYRPVLEPMGLTHPQYLVMLALWGAEPMSVKELSEALRLDPPTLSPLLKRLEAAGLLERRRLPEDQRTLAVTLTDRGRLLRRRALDVPRQVVERLGMDVAELQALRDGLSHVIDAAVAAEQDADTA
ncbi:MarR family transcriptional regulator [Kineococcus sp. T13]|uniref:MarR family transcriptional regulator n=1 Tax=Kineococcus vitellinus TaxID=2696565 RepID=UPI00141215BF|nr:MarR family transcriptional regulator [Kineococcus vitellinus]